MLLTDDFQISNEAVGTSKDSFKKTRENDQ
jgi:hypothetical protein